MSHPGEDTDITNSTNSNNDNNDNNGDEQQQEHIIQDTAVVEPMSIILHNPGSPAPMTPTSQFGSDNEEIHSAGEDNVVGEERKGGEAKEEEGDVHDQDNNNDDDTTAELLFQDVVFFLSPFLNPHLADEVQFSHFLF
jgi:hypothetical protein